MGFGENFVWGAATASYQIEGAAFEDGKGKNIWDVFSRMDGAVYEGHNGDVACDHYHRYREDVKILKELGVSAYRFSVNWARILPDGTGKVNEKGIEFYNDLINLLLENQIEPYLTLYHWELPYELHLQGGWMNPSSPEWFYQYAKVIAERFSDRVKNFFTLNEPQCIVGLGYMTGEHAPGLKVGEEDYFRIWHNVLMAHGRGVEALREYAKQKINVGIVSTGAVYVPETERSEDIAAAKQAGFSLMGDQLGDCSWDVALCCDPVYLKQYPEDILRKYGQYFPKFTESDMELIGQPVDLHGQNIYNGVTVRADAGGKAVRVPRYPGFPHTSMGWPVTPECLNWPIQFLYDRYKTPILITENGMASHDWVAVDGSVHDGSRVDFMFRYLQQLKWAVQAGADVRGYFAWSLLDNFEWAYGYSQRFGLIYVDYRNQQRIWKDSAYAYKDIIKTNGEGI